MKDLLEFQKARIEALEKLNNIQADLINAMTLNNEEMNYKYADLKAKHNILIRNIEVIDSIIEQPLINSYGK